MVSALDQHDIINCLQRYRCFQFQLAPLHFGSSNLEGFVNAMRHMSGREAEGFSMRPLMSSVR
jgi:hypothetical protein